MTPTSVKIDRTKKAVIRAAAKKRGISVSEFIRDAALDAARRAPASPLLGRHLTVHCGAMTGGHGRVDYVDVNGQRALLDFTGRFGGMRWVALEDLFDPTTNAYVIPRSAA